MTITPTVDFTAGNRRIKNFEVTTTEGIIIDQYSIAFTLIEWNPAAPTIAQDSNASTEGDPTTYPTPTTTLVAYKGQTDVPYYYFDLGTFSTTETCGEIWMELTSAPSWAVHSPQLD